MLLGIDPLAQHQHIWHHLEHLSQEEVKEFLFNKVLTSSEWRKEIWSVQVQIIFFAAPTCLNGLCIRVGNPRDAQGYICPIIHNKTKKGTHQEQVSFETCMGTWCHFIII